MEKEPQASGQTFELERNSSISDVNASFPKQDLEKGTRMVNGCKWLPPRLLFSMEGFILSRS